ncbi:MAG TPA: sporulation protein YqfD [Clostridia bacterium]|nr:sporulation protein YqfD [Clostridia bacterium]
MTLRDTWYTVKGSVRIRVTGSQVERFVNICTHENITLRNISADDEGITCSLSVGDFPLLRRAARLTRSRVRIIKKEGLYFSALRLRRHPAFIAGALLSILMLYFLSSLVWVIVVIGAQRVSVDRIMEAAREAGVRVGAFQGEVDPEVTASKILDEVGDLAWVGVRIRGCMVVIEVVEKEEVPKDPFEDLPCDIIARRDGVLLKLLAIQGEPMVSPGRTVRAGDVLISGRVPGSVPPGRNPGNAADSRLPGEGLVRARGIALASVWYEAYAEVPLRTVVRVRSGRIEKKIVLRYHGKTVTLYGRKAPSFGRYDTEERVLWRYRWRNRDAPVELTTVTFHEVIERTDTVPLEHARLQAKEKALELIERQLPPGVERARTWARVIQEGPNLVGAKVTVETVQDIGVPRPIVAKD